MGCSKPPSVDCQTNPLGLSIITCSGSCYYFFFDASTASGGSFYLPKTAKFIDQFTNEELLTEIRRRMMP